MTRIASIALAAATLALGAVSAQATEIRVPVAGKTPQQIHADIVAAASQVCWQDSRGDSLRIYTYSACVRTSVARAVARIGDPALSAYSEANPATVTRVAAR
jgi:hypothetical protein